MKRRAQLNLGNECLKILLEALKEAKNPPKDLLNPLEIAVKSGRNRALIPPELLPKLLRIFEAYAARRCGKERCPCRGYGARIHRNALCWIRYRIKLLLRGWRKKDPSLWVEPTPRSSPSDESP